MDAVSIPDTPVPARRPYAAALVLAGSIIALAAINGSIGERPEDSPQVSSSTVEVAAAVQPSYNYSALRRNIIYGKADLAEVRKALTETDAAALSNTVHALYSMRWHRGVVHVLNGMWSVDKQKYPELAWDLITKPPVRIAVASTINRIRIVKTEPYQRYIRSRKYDGHEFNRAQVSVSLGFNGDPQDLPYLREMADGDNHYVAQSAITALSLFGGLKARDVLIELAAKHDGSPRGDLMFELLRKAYSWPPMQGRPDPGP